MREKLVELLKTGFPCPEGATCSTCQYKEVPDCYYVHLADHLLANGVTFAEDNNVLTKIINTEPCVCCAHYDYCEKLSEGRDQYLVTRRSVCAIVYGEPCFRPKKEVESNVP